MRGAEGLRGGQGQQGIAVRTRGCIVRGVKIQRQGIYSNQLGL